jgi:putative SOS response-associated peptidase YedK
MWNLYNITTNLEAIRALTNAINRLGNLKPSMNIYHDQMAPMARNNGSEREAVMVRGGMPSSQKALFDAASKRSDKLRKKDKLVDFDHLLKHEPARGTTNIRNAASNYWKRWRPDEDCVVWQEDETGAGLSVICPLLPVHPPSINLAAGSRDPCG